MKTHGEGCPNPTREYRIWSGMVNRCTNPNNSNYFRYGGRGIGVSTRWRQYENFLADMGRAPTVRHSLDRIDGNGSYVPGNVRWATPQEQQRNRQDRRPLTIDGVTQLLCEWAEQSGTPIQRIWDRLKVGWLPARAVFAAKSSLHPEYCKRGHLLSGANVRMEGRSRRCVTCKREYDAQYRLKGAA